MAPVYFFLVAFSAALVTKNFLRQQEQLVQGKVLTLATLLGLLDRLDDTDGNGLPHITDSETAERRVLVVALNTHGFAGDKLGNTSITRLDEFGRLLKRLSASPVDLLNQLGEFAGNVGGVTVQDGGITRADLTGVVENDDLGIEGGGLLGRVVLGVRGNVSTTNILDRDVLDVETDVVTRLTGLELLVVHLDRLDFSSHVAWGEVDDHAGFDNASLNTTDGDRSDTTDLVNILEGETKGLVGRTGGRLNGINGIQKGFTLDRAGLGLPAPTLVPGHAANDQSENLVTLVRSPGNSLGGLFQHVVSVPSGNWDEGNSLGVVTDLFDKVRGFLDDFVETVLAPLRFG